MKVTNGLDLTQTTLTSAVIHPLTSDPGSPVVGQLWFRTDTGRLIVETSGGTESIALLTDVTGGAITGNLWDAQTVIIAVSDNTPVAQVIGENEFLGRTSGGDIGAVTAAQARTILNVADGATANTAADAAPLDVNTTAAVGVATDYAREDHVHELANSVVATAKIADEAVTLAKLAHVNTATILGRTTAATGDVESLTAAQARTVLNVEDGATANTAADAAPSNVGTTAAVGASTDYAREDHVHELDDNVVATAKIADEAVTLTKLAHVATDSFLGRTTAATGDVEVLTATQARTVLNVEDGATANTAADAAPADVATTAAVGASTDYAREDHVHELADNVVATAKVADEAITLAKLAHITTDSFLGRTTAATGDVEVLSAAQVRTILNVEDGATADQSAAEILALLLTVDGNGSGLDADTIGGIANADVATESYVDTAVANLVDSAPGTLDTLNELAAALGDDPNFSTTITNSIDAKPDKYASDIGNGSDTAIVVTHNLGTQDIVVSIRQTSNQEAITTDWTATSTNTATITFDTAPASGAYRVVIIG